MKRKHLLATAIPSILLASTAFAVRQPSSISERSIETATGGVARSFAPRAFATPRPALLEWNNFLAARGQWNATWDADTGVPSRITGQGVPAPGSVADASVAESAARAMLTEQIALLAPGANPADFSILANVEHRGIRTVRFAQHYQGLAVVGAQVMFTFEHDRLVEMGSSASPQLSVNVPASFVSQTVAAEKARAWVGAVYHTTPQVIGTAGVAQVLPIVRSAGKRGVEYRVVLPVTVDQASPRALWTVWVDATTGEPVARHQRLLFASGTVDFHTPIRYPLGGFADQAAEFETVNVAGQTAVSTIAGLVTWTTGSPVALVPAVSGTYATVTNGSGAAATANLQITDGGTTSWDESTVEFSDAQLAGYVNVNKAKDFARANYDPNLAWLAGNISVTVNENQGTCNAYSNLDDIHFFPSGGGCNNTGEISDVLFHEFGHSLHSQTRGDGGVGTDDGSLTEGVADFNAANMMNDPDLGLGFFTGMETTPLRQADPPDKEFKWPDDSNTGDPHTTGQIISGALWDLRKAAIATMGDAAGKAWTNGIYVAILANADDIPSTYQAALVADDDNGNLSDGTPHQCLIAGAFGPHGLGDATTLGMLAPPTVDNLTITLAQPAASNGTCPAPQITAATVDWRLRSDNTVMGTVDFTAGASSFTATLPTQANGEVIEYTVHATLDNGSQQAFPQNPADPRYTLFVGPSTTIYCSDFESDPTADGWTLGTGWAWGSPAPSGVTDDPTAAYSGAKEIGINLSGDYDPDTTYDATSQAIDVSAYAGTPLHLQFRRWLGVEDGIYDHAVVNVNGTAAWSNAMSDGSLEFEDHEWRFEDVDVTSLAASGSVQVGFHLDSDPGLQFGGWNVDDFCIVAVGAAGPTCGDGTVDTGEQCDDGNTTDGDGCSATCTDETGGGGNNSGCCSTSDDSGAPGALVLGFVVGGLVIIRRRRK